jgi:hypothetical protein
MRSAGSRGGVLVGVGFRVETCTWTNWAKKQGGPYPSRNICMDTPIGTYKYPILNNGAGYVSTAYPMRIRIQSTRDTGYVGYRTDPRRLGRASSPSGVSVIGGLKRPLISGGTPLLSSKRWYQSCASSKRWNKVYDTCL